jgi:tetratricopeptide (TPR) repeat protein
MRSIVPARSRPKGSLERDVLPPRARPPAAARSEAARSLGAFVVLVAAIAVVYARAVDTPFVFDDRVSIVDNPSILRLWPLLGAPESPGPLNPSRNRPTAGRPLVNLTFAINYHVGGLRPAGYRLVNLVVHLLSALLLASIVRRTLRLDQFAGRWDRVAWPVSSLAALVWAVHPLASETVVYVTQRTELLMTFFYLLTLYASLRYWTTDSATRRMAWLAIATVACLSGMASKEVMVSAPLVVLLFERTFLTRSLRATARSWPLYAGLALGWVLLFVLTAESPRGGSAGFHHGVPAHVWWFTQAKVLLLYLELAVWPWPLTIHYAPAYLRTFGAAWPWLVAVAVLGTGTLVLLWRRHPAGFVAASVWLVLAPTLVVPIVTEVAAERRMYLPLAGLTTLAIAGGYRFAFRRWPVGGGRVSVAAALALAGVLGAVTARRLEAYRTPVALWQDAVLHQPHDAVAQDNLGTALVDEGRSPEAMAHFEQALGLEPGDSAAHNNLGALLTGIGRPEDGVVHLRQALVLDPDQPKSRVHMNLGNALLRTGEADEAIMHLEQAVRLQPDDADAHYNLGGALFTVGRFEDATRQFEQSLRLKPDDAEALDNLASARLRLGDRETAVEYYRRALALKPDFAQAHSNLGAALAALGWPDEAIEHFRRSLQIDPHSASAHYNLGRVLLDTGRAEEAVASFEESVRLDPDNASARLQCAIAYDRTGRPTEAMAMARDALAVARAQGDAALAGEIEALLASPR